MTEARTHPDHPAEPDLSQLIEGFWITKLIGTAVSLGIPEHLSREAKSSSEIARLCEANPPCVLRLLRALESVGVCRSNRAAHFELTQQGQLLRRGTPGSIRGRALFTAGIMWDLFGSLTDVVKTGRPLPAGREGFNRLADSPGLAGMHRAMVESSITVLRNAADVYDFTRYTRALDVGGGYGGALSTLLQLCPRMSGSVLDLPYLAQSAAEYLHESAVGDRADFIAGDFFEAVPAGYDCYMLKYIVHDWDDAEALEILTRCAQAARPNAHVLLFERVMPETPQVCRAHQAIMEIDIAMMTTGGKERTEGEFRRLLSSAGLQMQRVIATGAPCSVIQAIPA